MSKRGLELIKEPNPNANRRIIYSPVQLTLHPFMRCGLEIDCMDGIKIKAGRLRGVNIWGCNYFELRDVWERNKVDPYIRLGSVFEIPYGNQIFDWVCYDGGFYGMTGNAIKKALKEIRRVSTDMVFIKTKPTIERPVSWWVDLFIQFKLYPCVVQVASNGTLGCELQRI